MKKPEQRNREEIVKLRGIMDSLADCLKYNTDPTIHLSDLTETIADLEGQIDLFEFSQDNERLLTAQAVLNSVYKCKCDFLELAFTAERKRSSLS